MSHVVRAADRRERMQVQAVHDLPRHDVDPAIGHLQLAAREVELPAISRTMQRGDRVRALSVRERRRQLVHAARRVVRRVAARVVLRGPAPAGFVIALQLPAFAQQPSIERGRAARAAPYTPALERPSVPSSRNAQLTAAANRYPLLSYNSRPRRTGTALRATHHLRQRSRQDLCVGLPGTQAHRPRDPPRRDLRAARPERRRQDHADQRHLRHRQRHRPGRSRPTATTSCASSAPRAPRSGWCRRS